MSMIVALAVLAQVLPRPFTQPVTAPIRDAGTLHLDTGTWTRDASVAALGSDVIFDSTCLATSYGAFAGDAYVREGRLPSPTSPNVPGVSPTGCATQYTIDGFRFAYCTDQASPGTLTFTFRESQPLCSTMLGGSLNASIALSNLPGSSAIGTLACWTVAIDLGTQSFTLSADGDGAYQGTPTQNLFGVGLSCSLPAAESQATGLVLGGDVSCSMVDGTRWDEVVDYTEPGGGLSINSFSVFIEPGGVTPSGCYVTTVPIQNIFLELYSNACPQTGTLFCAGDTSTAPCPCGNSSPEFSGQGCANSIGHGSFVIGSGLPSLTGDTFRLRASALPPSSSALFFQGTQRVNGGAGLAFGDGLRCAGGSVIRLGASLVATNGTANYPELGDAPVSQQGQIALPGLRTYQVWYRNAASFCTGAPFNLTNGFEALWAP